MSSGRFYPNTQDSGPPQFFSGPSQPNQYGNVNYPQEDWSQYSNFGGRGDPNSQFSAIPNIFAPMAQQFVHDPRMANMALNYGSDIVGQGAQMVQQKMESYMSLSRLKYYFAVNNSYVGKKILLLLFPYPHKEWSVKYDQQSEPVAPRDDVNAPDLYIPLLSFVTYILVAGMVLGTQSRFSPEHLGLLTSSALGWLLIEVFILMITRYLLQVESNLRYLDLIAYCGYKFIGMIACLVLGLLLNSLGYYSTLLWCGLALAYFLVKTLRLQIQPHASGHPDAMLHGNKRRVYLLLFIACIQPLLMWWLTRSVVFGRA